MTAALFLGYLGATAVVVAALMARYLTRPAAIVGPATLAAWLAYVGLLGHLGVLRNVSARPPGIVLVAGPVLAFLAFLASSRAGLRAALELPIAAILGLQSFRVGVELLIHRLWIDGLVPRMVTFEGSNVDIFIGASAPLAAWAATRGRAGARLALAWNVLGLIALANVVARFALTAPGPFAIIPSERPNLAFGRSPYVYIPGFLAPLAATLHVLAIRALRERARVAQPDRDRAPGGES